MPTPTPDPQVLRRIELNHWLVNGHETWIATMPLKSDEVVIVRSKSAFDCLIQLGRFEPTLTESEFLFGGNN